jgi:DNA helicase-2/ATP-dependent DNA helicase PcrA
MPAPEDLLDGLDPDQRRAAEAVNGPVLIVAGAGAGKTRTITHRIAFAVASGTHRADRGLAVTFTAKAAGEMRHRLAGLGVPAVPAMTFHAAALRQLRHFWPQAVGGPPPDLLTAKAGVLAEAAAGAGIARDRAVIRDLAAEIEWAKVSRVGPQEYAARADQAGRTPPAGATGAQVASVYAGYGEILAERGLMDFEDVLRLSVALLTDRPDLADIVRSRYTWFTVDEYQDVSPLQQALLDVWLGERDELCVVGDPGQTIYTFAGASPEHLLTFGRRYPGATVVELPRTYRCSPQIADVANRLTAAAGPVAGGLRLRSMTGDGPAPHVQGYEDDLAEAAAIAEQLRAWSQDGLDLRAMAVLLRTNAATAPVEDALAEAGVGYVVAGGERFFSRAEIRESIARLRGAANVPGAAEPPEPLTLAVGEVLAAMGFLAGAPPSGRGAVRERWESLAALSALAADLARERPDAGLADLVAELDRRAALEAAPVADGVTITTLHAAKGLEWDAVWIAGLQEGTLPISYADTPERIAEERRLLYVGTTRARQRLVLSWSSARSSDRGGRRAPSRFLRAAGLVAGAAGQAGAGDAGPRRPGRRGRQGATLGRCRVCGKGLPTPAERALARCRTCPEDIDVDLLARLKQWRTEQAAATGAPAYTVFTDLTLQAVAEHKPTTPEGLLAISGIGPVKAERYGADVLALVSGEPAVIDLRAGGDGAD